MIGDRTGTLTVEASACMNRQWPQSSGRDRNCSTAASRLLDGSVTWLLEGEVSTAFGVAVVRLTEPAATLAIAGRAER